MDPFSTLGVEEAGVLLQHLQHGLRQLRGRLFRSRASRTDDGVASRVGLRRHPDRQHHAISKERKHLSATEFYTQHDGRLLHQMYGVRPADLHTSSYCLIRYKYSVWGRLLPQNKALCV